MFLTLEGHPSVSWNLGSFKSDVAVITSNDALLKLQPWVSLKTYLS